MDESINFPTGYRFNPFENELISCYLKPKVLGKKLPSNVVEERQVYGPDANPWQVFDPQNHSWILSEVTPGKFEKVTYVFVNLTKIATVEREKKHGRDNYMKRAGCGTWGGKTSRTEIRDHQNGDVIGERRLLVFEIDDDSHQDLHKVGYWKMHEYRLQGVNDKITNPRNIVLCKITLDTSRHPAMKVHPKISHDHPVKSNNTPQKMNTNVESMTAPSTMNSSSVEENKLAAENSPSEQQDTGYPKPKPVSSDFFWPAKYGNDYKKVIKEEQPVEDTIRNLGKQKVKAETSCSMTQKLKPVSSDFFWPAKHDNNYQKIIREEQPVEDTTRNLGIEKVKAETSCLKNQKSKPVSSDYFWPAKHDNNYQKIKKEAGGGGDLHPRMTKVQFSSYPKPNEELSVEGTTRNLGEEKVKAETSCSTTQKLKLVSSDLFWPEKYDNNFQKIKKEAGGEGDLHSGMTRVQFSSYPKPKEEQSVEDTATRLGKRKVKVETSCSISKKLCPLTVIID